jgi:3-deoxy-D-manno-octulosonic-acid transferase
MYKLIQKIALPVIKTYFTLNGRIDEWTRRFPKKYNNSAPSIWVHASSVGEVNAAKPLINKLINESNSSVFMTVMTETGLKTAKGIHGLEDVLLFPFDSISQLKKIFKAKNPKLLIIIETEIWPGIIDLAYRKKIPVVMCNARVTVKSLNTYQKTSFIWKRVYPKITEVLAQSELDEKHFNILGLEKVINAGNLKFNLHLPKKNVVDLRNKYGFEHNDKIVVWGCSRPGEEDILVPIIVKNPKVKFVIVPRHLKRLDEVKLVFRDIDYNLLSDSNKTNVLIVDKMGVLTDFYAISDLNIVGGSFYDFGGHNPLESTYFGIPTIIGNYNHSCRDTVRILKQYNGIVVSDKDKLFDDVNKLLENEKFSLEIGANGKQAMEENSHSLEIHWDHLQKYLD